MEALGIKVRIGKDQIPDTSGKLRDVLMAAKAEGASVLINCTGLAAGYLCDDEKVYPARGATVRVETPSDVTEFMTTDGSDGKNPTYILPRGSGRYCTLGGTFYEDDWNTSMTDSEAHAIIDRCSKFQPSLADAKVEGYYCGLRPARKEGIRLELETLYSEEGLIPVIHNYGHGGVGWTTCWVGSIDYGWSQCLTLIYAMYV